VLGVGAVLREIQLVSSMDEVKRRMETFCRDGRSGYVCAVNANILVHAYKNKSYLDIISSSLMNFCDSTNVWLLSKVFLKERIDCIPGPQVFSTIIALRRYRSFFIGTTERVLDGLRDKMASEFDPSVRDMTFYSPPFLPVEEFDYCSIAHRIAEQKPDLIWVALGAPKQEIFMKKLMPHLDRGVMIGVGAAFNFFSGVEELKRAPEWMREIHLEWLFRAAQEPKKIIPRQLRTAYYLPRIALSELRQRLVQR